MIDCCEGEPAFGDPRGLHSLDCPVYLDTVARLEARRAMRCHGDPSLFNPAPCGRAEHHPEHG